MRGKRSFLAGTQHGLYQLQKRVITNVSRVSKVNIASPEYFFLLRIN